MSNISTEPKKRGRKKIILTPEEAERKKAERIRKICEYQKKRYEGDDEYKQKKKEYNKEYNAKNKDKYNPMRREHMRKIYDAAKKKDT